MFDLLEFTKLFLKLFTLFLFGIFIAFPISAMFGAIALFLSYLPLIWQILWRAGLGLMLLTSVTLFMESLNNGTKHKS